jgi:hypothetical protein
MSRNSVLALISSDLKCSDEEASLFIDAFPIHWNSLNDYWLELGEHKLCLVGWEISSCWTGSIGTLYLSDLKGDIEFIIESLKDERDFERCLKSMKEYDYSLLRQWDDRLSTVAT